MTITKEQKVRLGIFAVAAGALLAIVIIVFAGLQFWHPRERYYIDFHSSVYGLEEGADVFLHGVRVGKVVSMSLSHEAPGKVRVAIDVDEDAPIRTNTRAVLQYAGITGLKIVDLRDGTAAAPPLPPGSTIPVGETVLDRIAERGAEMLDQTAQLIERANAIAAQTEVIVENLARVSSDVQIDDIVAQTRTTVRNLSAATKALRGVIDENRAGVRASVEAIEDAATRVAELVDDAQVRAMIADLRQATRSFKELARELRQRPSRLLYSRPPRERELP